MSASTVCYDCPELAAPMRTRCEACLTVHRVRARKYHTSRGTRPCPRCGVIGHYQKTCAAPPRE